MENFSVKYLSKLIMIIIFLIPGVLLSIAIIKHLFIVGIISIALLFALIFLAPFVSSVENLWMYVLSLITLTPLNIKIAITAYPMLYDLFDFKALAVFMAITLFFIASDAEQIVLGLITRIVKPKQNEIDI